MITLSDGFNSLELNDFFVILPRLNLSKNYNKKQNEYVLKNYYLKKKKAKRLPENFSYNSRNNQNIYRLKRSKIIKDNFNENCNNPARANSRRIKNKNIIEFLERTYLLQHITVTC